MALDKQRAIDDKKYIKFYEDEVPRQLSKFVSAGEMTPEEYNKSLELFKQEMAPQKREDDMILKIARQAENKWVQDRKAELKLFTVGNLGRSILAKIGYMGRIKDDFQFNKTAAEVRQNIVASPLDVPVKQGMLNRLTAEIDIRAKAMEAARKIEAPARRGKQPLTIEERKERIRHSPEFIRMMSRLKRFGV
jgi:hypothetical protein